MALLSPEEAAKELNVSVRRLAGWRWEGVGPAVVYLNKKTPRYDPGALRQFIAECTQQPAVGAFLGARHDAVQK